MKPSVYLETSIISYLAANLSRDLITVAHQQITNDWWNNHRHKFELRVSQFVIDEISGGDGKSAKRRLAFVEGIDVLAITPETQRIARRLIEKGPLPKNAAMDAVHIAIAAIHGVDYLLTWNCKHIANLFIQKDLARILRSFGLELPIIGNPESFKEK